MPTDGHVLATMALVLKAEDRLPLLTVAFEKAIEKEPNDEELLTGLYAAYIRCAFMALLQTIP